MHIKQQISDTFLHHLHWKHFKTHYLIVCCPCKSMILEMLGIQVENLQVLVSSLSFQKH